MVSLAELHMLCEHSPPLLLLQYEQIFVFIFLLKHMRERLAFSQYSGVPHPPLFLPTHIQQFLQNGLHLDQNAIALCWEAFKYIVWSDANPQFLAPRLDVHWLLCMFLEHGISCGLGNFISHFVL